MPPKTKITRQMTADAAYAIVREEGFECLNVRRIAERLGCSTQPVLYTYKNVEEIRRDVWKMADEFHTEYIMPKENCTENPFLTLGLNYIRFGYEERNLFRFLFQTNMLGADMRSIFDSPELDGIIDILAAVSGQDKQTARRSFTTFFAVAHGFASLLANNAIEYDEEQIVESLGAVFESVMGGSNQQH